MLLTVRQRDCARGLPAAGRPRPARRARRGLDPRPGVGGRGCGSPTSPHTPGRAAWPSCRRGSRPTAPGRTRSAFTTDPAAMREVLAPHRPLPDQPGRRRRRCWPPHWACPPTAWPGCPAPTCASRPGRGRCWSALWSATGGYYLTEMLDPLADDPPLEQSLRRHVADFVRPGGPLPTVRIAAQPYGVLPILPRTPFRPGRGARAQREVQRVSAAMRRLAEPLVDQVPRLAAGHQPAGRR